MSAHEDSSRRSNEPSMEGSDEIDHVEQRLLADHGSDASQEPPAVTTITFHNAGAVVRFLTFSAGLSGLLFGFDTGVISSTLVSIGSDLSNRPLTTPDKSLVTAITSLLALLFAPTTGFFADRYGRKSVIFVPAVLFAIGALVQALAKYVWTMAFGRGLVGAAVGIASGAVPLYITELAPAELRGRLVTVQALFVTGGQVVAYLIGWIFAATPHGWRWMVGLGALPALLQLVLLFWMPDTPRWLVQVGKEQQARGVLERVYATLPDEQREAAVQHVLVSIKDEIRAERKVFDNDDDDDGAAGQRRTATLSTLRSLLSHPPHRRALALACLLQATQQLCGFNSLMYFSATIFALVGFSSPIGTSLSIAGTNFAFTLVAFAAIDVVGRRAILLRSLPVMVVGLLASALAFTHIRFAEVDLAAAPKSKNPVDSSSSSSLVWPVVLLLSMLVYVAAYAVGLGCVPWQQSELFPLRVRSLGSGLATATNWSSNFVIGLTFLPMMSALGPSITFATYAVVCLLGWLCIWRVYPETAGLELEDIGALLREGWGVQESLVRFEDWKRACDERDNLVSPEEQIT